MSADDAFNYGAIGVVIGHEMTHGFDDQGSQFDKDGNLNDWWTAEDRANFEARTKVMEEAFNKIEVAPGVHANGAFTLGENIADHGGLQISYNAFRKLPQPTTESEFTPAQRFSSSLMPMCGLRISVLKKYSNAPSPTRTRSDAGVSTVLSRK